MRADSSGGGRTIELPTPAATDVLGRTLAAALPADRPMIAYFIGDLGAGKTSLIRAMLRALGVIGPIRSPTYSIVERYLLSDGGVGAHLDLYRIADAEELDYLALDELSAVARLWCIEWPERFAAGLPRPDLTVCIGHAGDGRQAGLMAHSENGRVWLLGLASAP